jgi:hypothetical protein
VVLAIVTWKSVKQAGKELAASQRPIVVPLRDHMAEPFLAPAEEEGARQGGAAALPDYFMPIVNVGPGAALDIVCQVNFGDVHGARSSAPDQRHETSLTALGGGAQTRVMFVRVPLVTAMGFAFRIAFNDVAGTSWVARGQYDMQRSAYVDVEIEQGTLSTLSWKQSVAAGPAPLALP